MERDVRDQVIDHDEATAALERIATATERIGRTLAGRPAILRGERALVALLGEAPRGVIRPQLPPPPPPPPPIDPEHPGGPTFPVKGA